MATIASWAQNVALRKESVDRNLWFRILISVREVSLSARRAWIEMSDPDQESGHPERSLSARRAWIEMPSH